MWTWILSVTRAREHTKRKIRLQWHAVLQDGHRCTCLSHFCSSHFSHARWRWRNASPTEQRVSFSLFLFPSSKRDTKVTKCSSVVWYRCQISQPVKLWMWCCLRGVLLVAICNILTVSTYNSVIVDPNGRKDLFATLRSDWIETKLEPYWFHVDSVLLVWGALTWWL